MTHYENSQPQYERDPFLPWIGLLAVFAFLVMILGLSLGNAIAQRRTAMMEFVNSYQIVSVQAEVERKPVRVIYAR